MDFKSKYPAMSALLALAAAVAQDFAASGLSLVQKLYGLAALVPQALTFVGMVGQIAGEVASLKASPVDIEAGAEVLVVDLALSSDKAKSIVAAAFPVAEKIAELVSPVQSLIAAVKS